MKRRHHPEEIASHLAERFPPHFLTPSYPEIAEAVAELLAEAEPEGSGLTPEQAKALLEEVETPSPWPALGVAGEKKSRFDQKRCQHCGGLHVRKCPAVAEIEYHPDGKVKRVVYFPHGTWPADEVLWLEDVVQAAEEDE